MTLNGALTCLMTHPRGSEASAPGKTYLFMLAMSVAGSGRIANSQKTPDEILELPVGSDTGNLEDHQTIVGEEFVNFRQELAVSSDTDMLGHLETGDLVVVALLVGDLSVVFAQNSTLGL